MYVGGDYQASIGPDRVATIVTGPCAKLVKSDEAASAKCRGIQEMTPVRTHVSSGFRLLLQTKPGVRAWIGSPRKIEKSRNLQEFDGDHTQGYDLRRRSSLPHTREIRNGHGSACFFQGGRGRFAIRHQGEDPPEVTAEVNGVELQQAIGFVGEAFLNRMHNLVMLPYREPDLVRMLEFWPIGRNAIADAKRQFDEATIPACIINSLVEGVVGVLVAWRIAQFGIFAEDLRGANYAKRLNRARFGGETPASAFEFGHDFEQFHKLPDADFGDDGASIVPDLDQSIRRQLSQGFPNGRARRAVLVREPGLVQLLPRLQLE